MEVVLASRRLGPAVRHHLDTLEEMGLTPENEPSGYGVVVDAIVGYGLTGPLRDRAAELAAGTRDAFVVSLDMPSGHGASGAVNPDATLTLALPKRGLHNVSPLYLADLGLPVALWRRMGLEVPTLFASGSILFVGDETREQVPTSRKPGAGGR